MSATLKLYEAIRAKSDKRWKIWETFTAGEKIHVADVALYDEKTDNLVVLRTLMCDHRNIIISMNFLTPPVSSHNLADTSEWIVKKSTLIKDTYAPAMIEGMIYSGAIEPDYNTTGKVLQVGVGAGGLMNFIYSSFPNIDLTGIELSQEMLEIAKRWFNLETTERQRFYVEDGIDFIAREVAKGIKYDVILVDACHNGFLDTGDDALLGPVPPFRETSFFESAKKALTAKGTVLFNVIAVDGIDASMTAAEDFENSLKEVFDSTFKIDTPHNKVVGARMSPGPDAALIKKKIEALKISVQEDPTADIEEIY